jgi:hypothetical protein
MTMLEQIRPTLENLSRAESIKAMQILLENMARQEPTTFTEFEVWAPEASPELMEGLIKLKRYNQSRSTSIPNQQSPNTSSCIHVSRNR